MQRPLGVGRKLAQMGEQVGLAQMDAARCNSSHGAGKVALQRAALGQRFVHNKANSFKIPYASEAILGGCSGSIAAVFSNPFDVVKARLQLQREGGQGAKLYSKGPINTLLKIAKQEGLTATQNGLRSAVSFNFCVNSVRFGLYRMLAPQEGASASLGHCVAAGAAAGGFACLIASPLALVRTRQQVLSAAPNGSPTVGYQHMSAQGGVIRELVQILRQGGIRRLYKGCGAQLGRGCSATSVQFATYDVAQEFLRTKLGLLKRRVGSTQLIQESSVTLVAAALAQFVATVTIQPFDIAATRIYNQPARPVPLYTGALDCIAKTVRKEGFRGLYKGFGANLIRQLPHGCVTFVALEQLRSVCGADLRDQTEIKESDCGTL